MYVSVPKNYSGVAFAREERAPCSDASRLPPNAPPTGAIPLPPPLPCVPPRMMEPPSGEKPEPCEKAKEAKEEKPSPPERECCASCGEKERKNPLTCLFEALHRRERNGLDAEDFLLIGLIALLMNKEGNEEIVLILALLLLT